MLRRISLAALLHAAHAQQCGEGHLELDWSQARLKYNNLGGHGKVSGDPSEVRYENMGTLGGRQVDVVMKSRETDAIMEDKCDYPNNNRGRGSCWAEDATLWGYYGSLSTAKGWKNELKLNVKFIYNDDGSDATKQTATQWYDDFPHKKVPVLADTSREVQAHMQVGYWPSIIVLNENMEIEVLQDDFWYDGPGFLQ